VFFFLTMDDLKSETAFFLSSGSWLVQIQIP